MKNLLSLKYFSSKLKQTKAKVSSHQTEIIKETKETKETLLLLMDNSSAKKFYMINSAFLGAYSVYSFYNGFNDNFPGEVKKSFRFFGICSILGLVVMFLYGNRHVKSIVYNKTKNKLTFETYRCFGFLPSKSYILDPRNDIKKLVPIKEKLKIIDQGIHVIELRKREFTYCNNLFLRPYNIFNRLEFDEIMNKLGKLD